MFPTLIFGLLLLGASVRYATRPEARVVPLMVSLGVLTLVAGGLGFATGIITTMKYISTVKPEEHWVAMVGLGESMQNIAQAFVWLVLAAIAASIGAFRIARSSPEAARG